MATKPVYILGLSCYYHDSAAVLLKNGEIVFAAQEERYTRKKQDESFPRHAIDHALEHAGITAADLTAVAFYEKPILKFFDRILFTYFRTWPKGFIQYQHAFREWMTKKLWIPHDIKRQLEYAGKVYYVPHHESHAASSYFASGFPDATIITVDGVGEWATTTIGYGNGTDLTLKQEIRFPHSLGLLYSAMTYYLGFRVNSAEYKVMGLAPYGTPVYMEHMRKLITVKDDGSFRMNMKYFEYEHGMTMTGKKMEALFGEPKRLPESPLKQFHKDVAASLQCITEEIMLKIATHAKKICPSDYLCLAGGVALNCVANGKILRTGLYKDIFIQPAAGDAGGALGAALTLWHKVFNGARIPRMSHAFLGTEYSQKEIQKVLADEEIPYEELSDQELIERVSSLLEGTNVIGWFQGRMEYGPRSLGNRSILADARNKENWQKVNLKIKFRESFRPFAPTVLEEKTSDYFDLDRESPYMLLVADVLPAKRSEIPAVTHVDGSARIQTIRGDQNPRYHDLIRSFEHKTGCAVIINTSFNVRGEPIVESPSNALNCFLNTHMDYLVLGNFLISKEQINPEKLNKSKEYLEAFQLD